MVTGVDFEANPVPPSKNGSTLLSRMARWGAAVGAVIAAILAIWLVWQWTHESDPRAYPESQKISLNSAMEIYHIRLPECARNSVRYGRYGQFMVNSLYLHLTGDSRCMSDFLALNGLDDEKTFAEKGLPFSPAFGEEFGWPQDLTRDYLTLRGTLSSPDKYSSLADVEVAIDYAVNPHNLYLRASTL